ncbi:MAG: hypothetical protein LUC47_04035 [Clostridiales bacterium]|nr:hypothetical protein [Clostridiales bacterium]
MRSMVEGFGAITIKKAGQIVFFSALREPSCGAVSVCRPFRFNYFYNLTKSTGCKMRNVWYNDRQTHILCGLQGS